VDLRTLAPLDIGTVVDSATRTGRVLIVHEAVRFCGLGAEIAAQLGELAFGALKAPVVRLANPGVPVPFAPSLERAALPQVEDIVDATRELMSSG
jgi:pyruvate/2-oxoglutarate/acetoin dehydrogenase E1 component